MHPPSALLLIKPILLACKTLGGAMATLIQMLRAPAALPPLNLALHGKSLNIVHA